MHRQKKDITRKLSLGAAQFGFDYGIANKKGRVTKNKAFEILDHACASGISTIDTAYAYGESERTIGKFIARSDFHLQIISKPPLCDSSQIEKFFYESLKRLNITKIHGYVIHDFTSILREPKIWDILRKLKSRGKVEKIGFSLYYPHEAGYILENGLNPDIIQAPFSVLDQRFSGIFPVAREKNIEIHARSVFLQGLVFIKPDKLHPAFLGIKDKLYLLRSIAKKAGIPFTALFLNFAVLNKWIDKIIIGCDSLAQLRENINAVRYRGKVKKIYRELLRLKERDEKIILPINWQKEKQTT